MMRRECEATFPVRSNAERVAIKMNALDVAMTLNALAKMPAAADEISSPAGWDVLARATYDAAPTMSGKGRINRLRSSPVLIVKKHNTNTFLSTSVTVPVELCE